MSVGKGWERNLEGQTLQILEIQAAAAQGALEVVVKRILPREKRVGRAGKWERLRKAKLWREEWLEELFVLP